MNENELQKFTENQPFMKFYTMIIWIHTVLFMLYISGLYKGGSKFSIFLLSTDTTKENTWPPYIMHTIQYMIVHIAL